MSDISKEIMNKKPRLGRGLGSLLGGSAETQHNHNIVEMSETTQAKKMNIPSMNTQLDNHETTLASARALNEPRVWQVGIEKLIPNEFQPRLHFAKEKLTELANSISQNGILQPIVARKKTNGKFEIIAGERRWRAAQIAGLKEVPVILKEMEDQIALEMAIVENIQREDLNAIEEAEAYHRLATEFKLTQQQVADKVGKDRATVANSIRLLALPEVVRQMIMKSEISQGHAKVLLALSSPEKQIEIAKRILQQKLSVRQTEKLISIENQTAKPSETPAMGSNVTQRLISGLAEELQKTLATKVTIDYSNSQGKISIHFYSDDELTQIVNRLKERHGKH